MKFKKYLKESKVFYRWSNLGELFAISQGKRLSSLDVFDDPNFIFSIYSGRPKIGKGWPSDVYVRVILDSSKLKEWIKDPQIKGESAYRPKGLHNKEVIKKYIKAIKSIEIVNNPKNISFDEIKAWIKFHIGKNIEVIPE